ncbi:hypothetical protein LINGRAHAP2_LOCUS26905 [Linum grandiflorum]
MQLLFYSSRSYVVVNGKLLFLLFTVKQILLRITWLILVIPSVMRCICLILQIGVCPTNYIMILFPFPCLAL